MNSEVMQRLNQEQRKRDNIPNNTMKYSQLGPTDPAPKVHDTQLNEDENHITEEDDKEETDASLHNRRCPLRESRRKLNYKDMICIVGILGSLNNQAEYLIQQDEIYRQSIHFDSRSDFRMSSALFNITKDTFFTVELTVEEIHPCTYITQLQTHIIDTPSYKDILHSSEEEQLEWETAMDTEM